MPQRRAKTKAKSKLRRSLLIRRTPLFTAGLVGVVVLAVAIGRTIHPAGHAATDTPEIRVECNIDHFAADDPIVFPGQPGVSHMHSFYGNSTTNAYSTNASINASTSSCAYIGDFDRSAYWVPSLYYKNPDGTSTRFSDPQQQLVVYYRRPGGVNGPKVQPFPVGLRIIAGNHDATSPQDPSIAYWDCGDGGPQYPYVPDCTNAQSGSTPRGDVEFPNCWDGVHLDSADHKSHMAYANPDTGACPADHPVSLPQLHYEIWENGTTGGPNYYLSSSSDANGSPYTLHGDFIAAWDSRLQQGLMDNCMNIVITSCHVVQVAENGDVTHNGIYLFNLNSYPASPTPAPTSSPGAKAGDVNGDGQVNVFDLSVLLSAWNTNNASADVNKDGTVNVFDLSLLLSHWGA